MPLTEPAAPAKFVTVAAEDYGANAALPLQYYWPSPGTVPADDQPNFDGTQPRHIPTMEQETLRAIVSSIKYLYDYLNSMTPGDTPQAGVTAFLGLADTPAGYGGQALRPLRVNAAETGIEFFVQDPVTFNYPVQRITSEGNTQTLDATGGMVFDGGFTLTQQGNKVFIERANFDDQPWDFFNNQGGSPFSTQTGGTTVGQVQGVEPNDASMIGVLRLNVNSADSRAGVWTGGNTIILGGAAVWFDARCRLTVLSDATDTFADEIGMIDGVAGITDGVWVSYSHTVNGGRWQFNTSSNGVATAADTTVVVAALTIYNISVRVNAAGTVARCFIDGVLRATITTNIPVGIGRGTGFGLNRRKSLGTAARGIDHDYANIRFFANRRRA